MPSPEKKAGIWSKTKESVSNFFKSDAGKLFTVGVLGLAAGAALTA